MVSKIIFSRKKEISLFGILTILLVFLLHLSIFKLNGSDITFIFVFIWLWLFLGFKFNQKIRVKNILIFFVFLALPFVNLELNFEFLKSYILYLLFFVTLYVFVAFRVRSYCRPIRVLNSLKLLQLLLIFYIVLQYILLKYFDSTLLFNPWGENQFNKPYKIDLLYSHGVTRVTGLYLEPSVVGLVLTSLFWSIHVLERKIKMLNILLTFIGLSLAFSMAGFLTFSVVIMYYMFSKISVLFKFILLLSAAIIIYNIFSLIPRIHEFGTEGSSLYWRFIAPLIVLSDVLPSNLFGMPFGVMEEVVLSYNLPHGDTVGRSIDNGHLALIFYFGFFTLILYFYLIYIYISGAYLTRSFVIYVFFSLMFSGAVFNIEYSFLTLFLPLFVIKLTKETVDGKIFN